MDLKNKLINAKVEYKVLDEFDHGTFLWALDM